MKETDLIKLGFLRKDVLHEESQNGFDYHFYHKNLNGISLHSDCFNEDEWYVESWDIESLLIKDLETYESFEKIILKCTQES